MVRIYSFLALLILFSAPVRAEIDDTTISRLERLTPVETLVFERGRCFGTCPIYRVWFNRDGRLRYVGYAYTLWEGVRESYRDPLVFEQAIDLAQDFRPASLGFHEFDAQCEVFWTDSPTYRIKWIDAEGRETTLSHYTGCASRRSQDFVDLLDEIEALVSTADWAGYETQEDLTISPLSRSGHR